MVKPVKNLKYLKDPYINKRTKGFEKKKKHMDACARPDLNL